MPKIQYRKIMLSGSTENQEWGVRVGIDSGRFWKSQSLSP